MTQIDNAKVAIEAAMDELGRELGSALSFDAQHLCVTIIKGFSD